MEIEWLFKRHLPGYAVSAVTLLGEGWDNVVYEVNGELLVRSSKEPDKQLRAAAIEREVALLDAVQDWSTLAVPEVSFSDPAAGVFAYRKLEGVFLNDLENVDPAIVGPVLAEFHSGLSRAPLSNLVEVHDDPLPARLAEVAGYKDLVPQRFRGPVERFLETPPPDRGTELVFCHNDLGSEHILASPDGVPIAVIDWTDAAMADPAYDLGLILRDLGPAVLHAMARPDLEQRAWFHARCAVLGDIAYGVREDQPRYAAEGLASLEHLFSSDADSRSSA